MAKLDEILSGKYDPRGKRLQAIEAADGKKNVQGEGTVAEIQTVQGRNGSGVVRPVTPGPLSGGGIRAAVRQSTGDSGESGATTGGTPTPRVRVGYEEMYRLLNPNPIPSEEQLKKEQKKQKREQIFAAIGDGISALSNLYFTTQYAPNMYSGEGNSSERVRDKWERLAAERNANMQAYLDGLQRAKMADDEYEERQQWWKWRKKEADEKAEAAKADRDFKAAEAAKDRQAKKELQDAEQEFKAAEGDKNRKNQRTIAYTRNYNGGGSGKGDYKSFRVGDGEFVEVPASRLNYVNLKQIIDMLPQQAQEELRGRAYQVKVGDGVKSTYETRYEEPDADTYYRIIGSYMGIPEVANAVRELGGKPKLATGDTDWDRYSDGGQASDWSQYEE